MFSTVIVLIVEVAPGLAVIIFIDSSTLTKGDVTAGTESKGSSTTANRGEKGFKGLKMRQTGGLSSTPSATSIQEESVVTEQVMSQEDLK